MADQFDAAPQYREDALRTLHDTPIAKPLAVVSPKSWYFLATCVLVSVATLVWAFTYRIPDYVSADGICLVPESVRGIAAVANGRIAGFKIKNGQQIRKGDLIAVADTQRIDADISKVEHLHHATISANQRFEGALDHWLSSVLKTINEQKQINALRLQELNVSVNETQDLLDRQMEVRLTANKKLQNLFGTTSAQSRKIYDSMKKTKNRQAVFSDLTFVQQSRIVAEDERSKLNLNQQRMQIEEDDLIGRSRIQTLESQMRELESSNRRLSLEVLERKRVYESEMMARRLDEVKLSLELDALRAQKQREGFIRSSYTGTVLKFHKTIGDSVRAGERIGTLILDRESTEPMQCLFYFPIGAGNRISIGDAALTTPDTHRRERHGSIRGIVVNVDEYLVTEDSLFVQIGNRAMSRRLLDQGNLKGATIALEVKAPDSQPNPQPDPQADSQPDLQPGRRQDLRYQWTGMAPKDFTTLKAGTTANVRIRIDSRTPVEMAFTTLRRWLGSE